MGVLGCLCSLAPLPGQQNQASGVDTGAGALVEKNVDFVKDTQPIFHNDIVTRLPSLCRETDQAAAALVQDLKQCGLLDTTLVIWGGEFGRTPMNEEREGSKFLGRDHHPKKAFSMWLAGGGIKRGITLGETDELGFNAVVDPVHVHDLHATILHLMGINHTMLTYKFQGREFRLTDVHGNVVSKFLT